MTYKGGRFYMVSATGKSTRLKGADMRILLKDHDALFHYRQHKAYKVINLVSGGVAVGFGGTGLGFTIVALMNDDLEQVEIGVGLAAIGMTAFLLGEIPSLILATVQGRKTAKVYNAYLDPKPNRYSLGVGLAPRGGASDWYCGSNPSQHRSGAGISATLAFL